jgi:hypothetical protein
VPFVKPVMAVGDVSSEPDVHSSHVELDAALYKTESAESAAFNEYVHATESPPSAAVSRTAVTADGDVLAVTPVVGLEQPTRLQARIENSYVVPPERPPNAYCNAGVVAIFTLSRSTS